MFYKPYSLPVLACIFLHLQPIPLTASLFLQEQNIALEAEV